MCLFKAEDIIGTTVIHLFVVFVGLRFIIILQTSSLFAGYSVNVAMNKTLPTRKLNTLLSLKTGL